MKRRTTLHKRERVHAMKKSIYETIKTALTNYGYDNEEVLSALDAEINKGAEAKAKNAEDYVTLHDMVMDALSKTASAVTIAELWDSIEEDATTQGFTKGKVQYGLTKLWTAEIVKIEGKPNTYRKA